MSVPQSTNCEKSASRSAWERPAITELRIGTATKSNRDSGQTARTDEPSPPAAPTTKLGFSIEAAFPLSNRTEK